jgi:hypothetical protein
MDRRTAVKTASLLLGGALAASTGILAACRPGARQERRQVLSSDDEQLIAEVADTLLPSTPGSPGAKAAGAGAAINLLLSDCYQREAQQRVVQGLGELRARCEAQCGNNFAALPTVDRERVLRAVDGEAVAAGEAHWFHLVRELSLRAYFSSETGMTKALRYSLVPGRWVGCVPLDPGQPAWG